MFAISVEAVFHARHHIRFADGTTEAPHFHDWRVRIVIGRPRLDELGMVADFDEVRDVLKSVVQPFESADLNVHPALQSMNPTAEVVAKRIYDRLLERGLRGLQRVEVTESPGCVATFDASARPAVEPMCSGDPGIDDV